MMECVCVRVDFVYDLRKVELLDVSWARVSCLPLTCIIQSEFRRKSSPIK